MEKSLLDIDLGNNFFFIWHEKLKKQKQKTDKCNYSKLKSFCISKKKIQELKRWSMEWKKIFANYVSDKGLIFRICK